MFTSNRTIKWIENLADQELQISAGQKNSIDILNTKEEVLNVETATFVRDLYFHVEYLAELFNVKVSNEILQLRLSRTSEQAEGFCVSRNGMRLTLTKSQPGIIQLQCDKLIREEDSRSVKSSVMFSGLIESDFGPFHDVQWTFLGSPVTAEQVARHYLTEFIQVSRVRNANT